MMKKRYLFLISFIFPFCFIHREALSQQNEVTGNHRISKLNTGLVQERKFEGYYYEENDSLSISDYYASQRFQLNYTPSIVWISDKGNRVETEMTSLRLHFSKMITDTNSYRFIGPGYSLYLSNRTSYNLNFISGKKFFLSVGPAVHIKLDIQKNQNEENDFFVKRLFNIEADFEIIHKGGFDIRKKLYIEYAIPVRLYMLNYGSYNVEGILAGYSRPPGFENTNYAKNWLENDRKISLGSRTLFQISIGYKLK